LVESFEDAIEAHDRGDYEHALRIWRSLADQGNAMAQFNIGQMYAKGRGVSQDYVEAVRWYRRAADQGLALAQFNLGSRLAQGMGVPQDLVEAANWYRSRRPGRWRCSTRPGYHVR
jgi:TPR repeat protein